MCLLPGGGGVCSAGVCSGGLSAPQGVSAVGGGVPACTEADPSSVDKHTRVET